MPKEKKHEMSREDARRIQSGQDRKPGGAQDGFKERSQSSVDRRENDSRGSSRDKQ